MNSFGTRLVCCYSSLYNQLTGMYVIRLILFTSVCPGVSLLVGKYITFDPAIVCHCVCMCACVCVCV